MADEAEDDRRTAILDAALVKFSAYGLARTSMADIAAGAGTSRPALYQHFANKNDIFRAMLQRILETTADLAVAELNGPGTFEQQLDGFLQRWYGDMSERLYATQHGADIVEAKASHAKSIVDAVHERVRRALTDRVRIELGAPRTRRDVVDLVDLVLLSPVGFKYDEPSIATMRRRLTSLAHAVASATAG